MHKFTVNILADNTRTAAEMCKTASEALSSGTMRLREERAKGSVEYTWEPGLAALHYAPGATNVHRLNEAAPSLYGVLKKPGGLDIRVEEDGAPAGTTFMVIKSLSDGITYRFAVSANEAVLVRTIP